MGWAALEWKWPIRVYPVWTEMTSLLYSQTTHEPLEEVPLSEVVLWAPPEATEQWRVSVHSLPSSWSYETFSNRGLGSVLLSQPHSFTFIPPIHSQKDHLSAGPYFLILHSSILGSLQPSQILNVFCYCSQTTVQKLFMAPNFPWIQLPKSKLNSEICLLFIPLICFHFIF